MEAIVAFRTLYEPISILPYLFADWAFIRVRNGLPTQLTSFIDLRDFLLPKKANAILRPTKALSVSCLEGIHIVVKSKFLSFFDLPDRKDPNACLSSHIPLLCFTVRIAAVVDQPSHVAHVGRVNHFILRHLHQVCHIGSFVLLSSRSSNAAVEIVDLSYILDYKLSFLDLFSCCQAPSFVICFNRISLHVLLSLESPISTELSTVTCWKRAFNISDSVQTFLTTREWKGWEVRVPGD